MPLSHEKYAELEALVNGVPHVEIQCGNILALAPEILVRGTPVSLQSVREDRGHFGATDMVVTADMLTGTNQVARVAYIWELKAPQCRIMEPDDNAQRYRPTKDLIKAENQLIHYASQAFGDQTFRERMGVMESANILVGGIVIGRSADMVSGATTDGDRERARRSLSYRTNFFYSLHGIQVMTWDRVLASVKPT